MSGILYDEAPPCMSEQEYRDWRQAASAVQASGGGGRRYNDLGVRPCQDCTREFSERMLQLDRCDSAPGRFIEMTEDERRRYHRGVTRRSRRRRAAA